MTSFFRACLNFFFQFGFAGFFFLLNFSSKNFFFVIVQSPTPSLHKKTQKTKTNGLSHVHWASENITTTMEIMLRICYSYVVDCIHYCHFIYKILLMVFKCLHNLAPSYLSNLIIKYTPNRALRSSSKNLLVVPPSRTKGYGDRAFSVCGPKLWNNLPESLRHETKLELFKKNLKTYLF